MQVVLISVALHIAGLFALGGFSLYKVVVPEEAEFVAPEIVEIPEEKPGYNIKFENRQKRSAKVQQRISNQQRVSVIALPELDVQVPQTQIAIGTGGRAVAGQLGGGFGSEALDLSMSAVDFFGIKSKGENIMFVVDVARSMLEPHRGDVDGFNRVKAELIRMINELNSASLFNICVFANGLDVYSSVPVTASPDEKKSAAEWIDEYWRYEGSNLLGSSGVRFRNYSPDFTGHPIRRNRLSYSSIDTDVEVRLVELPKLHGRQIGEGSSRMDMALFASFELRVDTIFMITDGTPQVAYQFSEDGVENFTDDLHDWIRKGGKNSTKNKRYQKELKNYYAEVAEYQRERLKRGLPMEVNEHGEPGGIRKPKAPKGVQRPEYDPEFDIEEMVLMIQAKAEQEYANHGKELPSLNIIGYSTDDVSEGYLKRIQRKFPQSKFRRIGGSDIKKYGDESA